MSAGEFLKQVSPNDNIGIRHDLGRLKKHVIKIMEQYAQLENLSLIKQVEDIKRESKLEELNDLKTYAGFMSDMSSKTYLYSRILERIKTLNNDK